MTKHMLYKHLRALLIVFFPLLLVAEPTPDAGKIVFNNNCGSCHTKNMKTKGTGPALANILEDWAEYPEEDLYNWIRNSQAMISAGHPRAVELWNEYKPTVMNAMPNLTDEDIASVLLYIDGVAKGTYGAPVVDPNLPVGEETEEAGLGSWVYLLLLAFLGMLALLLSRIIGNLNQIAAAKEGTFVERKSLTQTLTSKGVITFLIFAGVVLGGYTTVNNAVNLQRQQGYAPQQPIEFSHETHAGINKIDCQYCHDGARRSKHAVIPATNTCMNCHKAITVGSKHGTQEITKIFASSGFDPNENKYIEDVDDVHPDTLAAIYKNWIAENYMTEKGLTQLDSEGEDVVEEQWANIVESLTNEQKKKVTGPIEWERIHNLPDHVYFNHAQHVDIGKIECQTCHGPMEEMAVAEQYAPLSMGWCINCHRETKVQFEGNKYYESYAKYHEELASGDREAVTVEDIGGLECQKCHY